MLAIEPRIGHLKNDFRLDRNFLEGQKGDTFNLLLAEIAWNLNHWMSRGSFSALFKGCDFYTKIPSVIRN
jgi:hypothetical protein